MYLSKVVLYWPACRNPYHWHRLIWRLFPNRPVSNRDYQFSCLDRRPGRDIPVLLLSMEKPVRLHSPEIALVGESKPLESLLFKPGQKLRFRLSANPTKVLTEETKEKRKIRVPLIKPEQHEAWLKRHLEGGATVESITSQNETPIFFNRKGGGGKIVPVQFEGILKVVNPELFKEQIFTKYDKEGRYIAGIGPAKAFGCGFLLVRPI